MGLQLAMRLVSMLSAISSLSVAATCIAFKSMRQSVFTRIICMIALSDVAVSLVGLIGFPRADTYMCMVQGAVATFFLRANWLWTTTLVVQMHRFITSSRVFFSEFQMHLGVWLTCAVLTFVPIVNGSFGRTGVYGSTEMCFITSHSHDWLLGWMIADWQVVLFSCIFIMLFLITKIIVAYRRAGDPLVQDNILLLVKGLYVYPLLLLMTWGVNSSFDVVVLIISGLDPDTWDSYVVGVSFISAMTNGILLAVFFFAKSEEARYRWRRAMGLLAAADDDHHTATVDFNENSDHRSRSHEMSNSLLSSTLFISDSSPTSGVLSPRSSTHLSFAPRSTNTNNS